MTHPIRSILALSILVIVLAACSTTIGAPDSEAPVPSEPATPSVEPSIEPSVEPSVQPSVEPSAAPSEAPADEPREVAGTITVAEGMTWSGPGATIQEVLDIGDSGEYPTLANGVLFRDTDGKIYLATAVSNVSAPTFDGPMLEVVGLRNEGPEWDMANAELLLLEEANGIIFRQNSQILGFLDVR
jgi:hypothetical protein